MTLKYMNEVQVKSARRVAFWHHFSLQYPLKIFILHRRPLAHIERHRAHQFFGPVVFDVESMAS